MTSHSDYEQERERRRRKRAEEAGRAYLEWAKGPGKEGLTIEMGLREWVVAIGAVTLHAAQLCADGGNPDILLLVARVLTDHIREVVGADETSRLLDLLMTMMTGMEP